MKDQREPPPAGVDASVAHSARVWNYWLGGKDNYAADRALGDSIRELMPEIEASARSSRGFLHRAVRYLVNELGVRQFLDIGTGLPSADSTHAVVQAIAPECRVVYVDNDPLVLAHARALLFGTPEGATAFIDADAREPGTILAKAVDFLDFGRPVGLILGGILGHITDQQEALFVLRGLFSGLPFGSYLVWYDGIFAETAEVTQDEKEALRRWDESVNLPYLMRDHAQIEELLSGLELIEPGIVRCSRWHPDIEGANANDRIQYCAVARIKHYSGESVAGGG